MRFWIREVTGWLLIVIGLYFFLVCFSLLLTEPVTIARYLEAGPLTFIGIIVFRGGIHLLKVATAARICMNAEKTQAAKEQPRPTITSIQK